MIVTFAEYGTWLTVITLKCPSDVGSNPAHVAGGRHNLIQLIKNVSLL